MEKQVNISSENCLDKISEGSYVVFKSGASHINEDKRLETRFLVVRTNDSNVAIEVQNIGIVAIEKSRLELAPNQEGKQIMSDLAFSQIDGPAEVVTLKENFECPCCGRIVNAGEDVILDGEYCQKKQVAVYSCRECAGSEVNNDPKI